MSETTSDGIVESVKLLANNADKTPDIYLNAKLIVQLLQLHAAANDAQYQLFDYLLTEREGKTGNLRITFNAVAAYGAQTRAVIMEVYDAIARQYPNLDMPPPQGTPA